MSCAEPEARPPGNVYERRRSGSVYGAFAFGSIIFSSFGSYLYTKRFFQPEEMVPVTFALGGLYAALGILWGDYVGQRRPWQNAAYYLVQCAILTAMVFLSPARGFFGMIVLPLVSQSVFDLRPRYTALVIAYLFFVCVGVWGFDFGWAAAAESTFSYAAGFAFTVVFTYITKQAVFARRKSELLQSELETANAQLRAQAEQTAELATTRERNRVAREIHDGVGHYLTVVKTQLDAASALLPAQPEKARESVDKAARLAAEALDDVRRSVGALRTDTARPPLPQALRELVTDGDPAPILAVEGEPRALPPGVEHALYRAAQEGLTNIRKHARATRALVRLDFRTPQRIVLELADNGVGTSPGVRTGGFGLQGLRERIELLGGTVATGNRLEGGFALRVEVPA